MTGHISPVRSAGPLPTLRADEAETLTIDLSPTKLGASKRF
jgi:hypothetical protein